METQRTKVEEARAKLNNEMKEPFIEFEATPPSETTMAPATPPPVPKPPIATLTSDMLTPAVLAKHMAEDHENLQGLNQEQGMSIMRSMFALCQKLSTQPQEQPQEQPQQQPQAAAPAPTPPPQAGEQDVVISEDEAESGDEAKMILVVSRNKARKAKRDKAVAAKGLVVAKSK